MIGQARPFAVSQWSRSFASGIESIEYTVDEMARLAKLRRNDPQIRRIGGELARYCDAGDRWCQASTILAWVRFWILWVPDPPVELVQDPIVTLYTGAGDCDDLSPLYIAIAESIGIPAGLAIGTTYANAAEPTHVLPAVKINGPLGLSWYPAEVSAQGDAAIPFGQWPAGWRLHSLTEVGK